MGDYLLDKITVIIPAYNAEEFIERAVMSVVRQKHDAVEIIIINDGSTDNTKEIAERLRQEHQNICLINTENHGVSHARNVGLDLASGEYVTFLDADDEIAENALIDMLHCIKKAQLDILSCKFCVNDLWPDEIRDTETLYVYKGKEALLRAIEDQPETYSACAKLYKRSAIENVRFPEGKRIHEDSFFVFQCLAQDVLLGVYDKTVYILHCVAGSASRGAFSEKYFDILDLAERKYKIILEQFPEYAKQATLLMVKANMAMLNCLCKARGNEYRAIEKECCAYVIKNRKYFKPAIKSDIVLFWCIRLHIFGAYKILYRIRYGA